MRTLKAFLWAQIVFCSVHLYGENRYPRFTRSEVPRFSIPSNRSFSDVANQALSEVNTAIAEQMGKKPSERIESGVELQTWLSQNSKWVADQAKIFRERLDTRIWPTATAPGRMPLPSVLANNGSGLVPGIDCMWSIHNLADDTQSALAIMQYGMFWQVVFENDPTLAVSWLAANKSNSGATTAEIVELQSALGYWPGGKLASSLSKQDWQALHQSANVMHRFIALEKFDSVDQSPAELLALYRECLFGACSYLEVRALEAITRNKDFREEVAKLLEEYIASNPPANDGTLPHLRNNFPNLIEGAQRIISIIRGTYKPDPPQMLSSDPFAQQAVTSPPMPAPGQPNSQESPGKGPISSTLWLILGVIVVAVTSLLWLFIKKRK